MPLSTLSSAYASLELLDDARALLLRDAIAFIDQEKRVRLESAVENYSIAQSELTDIVFAVEGELPSSTD